MTRHITLYVNYFESRDRQEDLDECLRLNIANIYINRIVLLTDTAVRDEFMDTKVMLIRFDTSSFERGRPVFSYFFGIANQLLLSEDALSIIANSDIYFDESLRLLSPLDLSGRCLALTRHERRGSDICIECRENSQDVWIFQGEIRPLPKTDFSMGRWACDNRLAAELRHAGYTVSNPCFDVHAVHIHQNWKFSDPTWPVAGPYENVRLGTLAECAPAMLPSDQVADEAS